MPDSDLQGLPLGKTGSSSLLTTQAHSARQMGSGTLDVFSTPMMVALMEAAAVDCVGNVLPPGFTSLGTRLDVKHVAPTAIGSRVEATAELTAVDGRTISFRVQASDSAGLIGEGQHSRVVVEANRFLQKVQSRQPHSPSSGT